MSAKIYRPSSNYQLTVSADVRVEQDGRVTSFWIDGEPLLLQLSSYLRESGDQIGARDRLRARQDRHAGNWQDVESKICLNSSPDQASAEVVDDDGVVWLHTYLVWPHLAIYATISGPSNQVRRDNWALDVLNTIEFVKQ